MSEEIEKYCAKEDLCVVGKIPFDPEVLDTIKKGLPVENLSQNKSWHCHYEYVEKSRRIHLFKEIINWRNDNMKLLYLHRMTWFVLILATVSILQLLR